MQRWQFLSVNDETCFVSVLVRMICVLKHTGILVSFIPAANVVPVACSNTGLRLELIRSSFLLTCISWYSSGVWLDAGCPRAKLLVKIMASSRRLTLVFHVFPCVTHDLLPEILAALKCSGVGVI